MTRIGCVGIFLWVLAAPAFAQDVKHEQADVARRLTAERAVLEGLKQQKVGVLEAHEFVERRAKEARRRADRIENQLNDLDERLAGLEKQEQKLEKVTQSLLDRLSPRLFTMYRLSRRHPLEWLLSAEDFARLLWRQKALGNLLEKDLSLLEEARAAQTLHHQAKRRLDSLREAYSQQVSELRAERAQAIADQAELKDMLNLVMAEASVSSRTIKELEAAQAELSQLVRELQSNGPRSGFAALLGVLPLPTRGFIELGFGKVVNPKFNTVTVQKGVDIRAAAGSPVQAIAPGKVVHAGWVRGYGNVLIIDHFGGFHTLMAHLQGFAHRAGDSVGPGEVVGYVGDTASMKGSYLYFEVRRNGQAIDPAPWFAAER